MVWSRSSLPFRKSRLQVLIGPVIAGMCLASTSFAPTSGLAQGAPPSGAVAPGDSAAPASGSTGAPAVGPARAGVANPHTAGGLPTTRSPSAGAAGTTPLVPKAAAPLEPGNGLITGKLLHPNAEKASLEGFEVRLFAFEDQQRLDEQRVESAPDGSYRFEKLNTRPTVKYIVSAMYQGVVYLGSTLQFDTPTPDGGAPTRTADTQVYDSAPAPGPLLIDSQHFIVEGNPANGQVRITEVIAFNNPGQQTLVGSADSTTTLQLDVPPGFTNLNPLQGLLPNQLTGGEKTVSFTGPFYPGINQVVFSYDYPVQNTLIFRRRLPVAASSVDVFVQPDGPSILSPQFQRGESLTLQETQFERFSAGAISAGSGVTFQIGGGQGDSSSDQTQVPGYALAGIITLGFLVFIGAPLVRRRSAQAPPEVHASAEALRMAELLRERDRQLSSVKEADMDFESGKLSEEDYQAIRTRHKALAIEALRGLEALKASGSNLPPEPAAGSVEPAAVAGEGVVSATVAQPLKFCTACGTPTVPGDKFCGACGTSLRPTVG